MKLDRYLDVLLAHRPVHQPKRRGRPRTKPVPEVKPCACGCGKLTNPGRTWLHGHRTRIYPLKGAPHAKGSENPARDAEIVMLATSGLTLQEVGDAVGLTRERVRQICVRMGFLNRGDRHPQTGVDPLKVAALAKEGLTVSEIGKRLGTDAGRIGRVRDALGLDMVDGNDRKRERHEPLRAQRRAEIVAVIRRLYAETGRSPNAPEIWEAWRGVRPKPNSAIPQLLGALGPVGQKGGYPTPPGAFMHQLYAEAGCSPPGRGVRSHTRRLLGDQPHHKAEG